MNAPDPLYTRLHSAMAEFVIAAIRDGRNERLPAIRDGGEGSLVSERLSNCDAEQERLLFQLLHHILNRDNLAEIHRLGAELAVYVANEWADLYVESQS